MLSQDLQLFFSGFFFVNGSFLLCHDAGLIVSASVLQYNLDFNLDQISVHNDKII